MGETDRERNQARARNLQSGNPFLPAHQIVYHLLLEDIMACRLEPGARLTEEQCASLYGSSRTTVRKVFDRLVEEGWLDRNQGHRIKVSKPSWEDHLELMEYRMAIEPAAARLAARNRTRESLQIIEQFARFCDTADVYTLNVYDTKFHRALFAASKNRYLIAAYEQIDMKMSWAKLYSAQDFESYCRDCYLEHYGIYRAIQEGNEALAHKRMFQHIKMMLDANFE